MPSSPQQDERSSDWSAVFDAWVDARVAIAIAGHQSVIKDLAASSVEFSATVQTRLDAVEWQIGELNTKLAELREELCRRQRRKQTRE
jgi:hypothetical protein